MLNIRPATGADAPTIASLVRELADYEKLLHEAKATRRGFPARARIAEPRDPRADRRMERRSPRVSRCISSTSRPSSAGPGLYLEDLFVRPAQRSHGIGRALLRALARIAEAARLRPHGVGGARLERARAALLQVAGCAPDERVDHPPPHAGRDRQARGRGLTGESHAEPPHYFVSRAMLGVPASHLPRTRRSRPKAVRRRSRRRPARTARRKDPISWCSTCAPRPSSPPATCRARAMFPTTAVLASASSRLRGKQVVLYCRSGGAPVGGRGAEEGGLHPAAHLEGDYLAWEAEQRPSRNDRALSSLRA